MRFSDLVSLQDAGTAYYRLFLPSFFSSSPKRKRAVLRSQVVKGRSQRCHNGSREEGTGKIKYPLKHLLDVHIPHHRKAKIEQRDRDQCIIAEQSGIPEPREKAWNSNAQRRNQIHPDGREHIATRELRSRRIELTKSRFPLLLVQPEHEKREPRQYNYIRKYGREYFLPSTKASHCGVSQLGQDIAKPYESGRRK